MQLQNIPLDQLVHSPSNVRKTAGGHAIRALATSIVEHGLLHNLTVLPRSDGTFEVIDGGRRLAALQQLAKKKAIELGFAVPCLVRPDHGSATELSAAANAFTEPMHPADQCEAFKTMIEQDQASIADVAARFSVSELVVKQRLKLANVSPKLVELYRAGKANLEQMQVLALSDDHAVQEKAWFGVKHDYERQAHSLRRALTNELIAPSDDRVRLVGLDVYEAAGGRVVRDLFAERDAGYLADSELLDRLVTEKLEATAAALQADGWGWVDIKPEFSYEDRAAYRPVQVERVKLDPTPEQAARLEVIAKRDNEVEKRLSMLEGPLEPASEEEQHEINALYDEASELEDEKEAIEAALVVFPPEVKAVAGAVVTFGYHGIEIHDGRLRPGEKLAKGAVVAQAAAKKPAKPEHSDAVMRSLSAHRSAVARHHVSGDPQLALAMVVERVLTNVSERWAGSDVLSGLTCAAGPDLVALAPDLDPVLIKQYAEDQKRIKEVIKRPDLLKWLVALPVAKLLELLALGVGTTFDGTVTRGTNAGVDRLHTLIGFDMADHWKPDPKQYLGRVSSEVVLKAVAEACGKKEAAPLAKLKKKDLVARAGPLLTAKKWLPKPLRKAVKKVKDGKQKAAGDVD